MKNNFPTEPKSFAEELREEHRKQLQMRPWFWALSTTMRIGDYTALAVINWKIAVAVFFIEWGAQIKTKFLG